MWDGLSGETLQGNLKLPILPGPGCSPSLFPAIRGYSHDLPEAQAPCRQIPEAPENAASFPPSLPQTAVRSQWSWPQLVSGGLSLPNLGG